ncbi:MAG: RNA methyltransferase [Halioglobus sp.]|nr:RNA methyltransferase [Halioglobus sp.]
MSDSSDYAEKKSFFDKVLTVYGRKPVLETLQNDALVCHAVHLAHSNRDAGIISEIKQRAGQLGVPVKMHSREELSRISKNGRQDQGVAVDVLCPTFRDLGTYLAESSAQQPRRLLALDGITNPQNLGMIIRSAAAGAIDGILLPRKGTATLGPLVIKASAGTLYRAPLLLCASLPEALRQCQEHGAQVCTLDAGATRSLFEHRGQDFCVYVLGNETEGVSSQVNKLADVRLSIPMRNGVESLNVAVTASLIAYGTYLDR